MIPMKYIRDNVEQVKTGLGHKGLPAEQIDQLLAIDETLRSRLTAVESLKAERNKASELIAVRKREGQPADEQIAAMGRLSSQIKALDKEVQTTREHLHTLLFAIPNLPHASTPVGADESANKVIETNGEPLEHTFEAREQHQLLTSLRLVDFEAGVRMSGKGFPVYTGRGARLERALINFMLDLHTREHGYTELYPPFLTTRASATTTGQLPKLEEDMYVTTVDDLFLIPTAEVPVTNYYQGEVLSEEELPVKFTAFSACFRREAGSYGKETKGLLRLHQFNKVELVKFVHPDSSYDELMTLRSDAERVLQILGLAYRVVELCTGDLSFAGAKCFDLEVYAPATKRWLEVSSCSNYEAFQARRGSIKYRKSKTGKLDFVHTLNGSGVATPRLMVALLENYQQRDGSIRLPEALVPYFGAETVEPE
ncbi:MAG: serine--tRNA ligase [Candidatus Marinimicrobia bacterium]|nr:serine--tRNA ligase [Candidatus Neomarinimicrobiota bacterium]